jgi:hypothetical protein
MSKSIKAVTCVAGNFIVSHVLNISCLPFLYRPVQCPRLRRDRCRLYIADGVLSWTLLDLVFLRIHVLVVETSFLKG